MTRSRARCASCRGELATALVEVDEALAGAAAGPAGLVGGGRAQARHGGTVTRWAWLSGGAATGSAPRGSRGRSARRGTTARRHAGSRWSRAARSPRATRCGWTGEALGEGEAELVGSDTRSTSECGPSELSSRLPSASTASPSPCCWSGSWNWSTFSSRRERVDRGHRVVADHEVLAVGEERAVGGDRQDVAERLELVGTVRIEVASARRRACRRGPPSWRRTGGRWWGRSSGSRRRAARRGTRGRRSDRRCRRCRSRPGPR